MRQPSAPSECKPVWVLENPPGDLCSAVAYYYYARWPRPLATRALYYLNRRNDGRELGLSPAGGTVGA